MSEAGPGPGGEESRRRLRRRHDVCGGVLGHGLSQRSLVGRVEEHRGHSGSGEPQGDERQAVGAAHRKRRDANPAASAGGDGGDDVGVRLRQRARRQQQRHADVASKPQGGVGDDHGGVRGGGGYLGRRGVGVGGDHHATGGEDAHKYLREQERVA
nr:unnamed protein product [Digitaria exilis]